ncbi:MAG: hypothetical protein AB7I79_06440 [Rhizobiaceae bacterium]
MKRLLAIIALLVGCGPASAGVLTCSFTEPFFTITFDSATGVVTWVSADEADVDTGEIKPRVIAENARLRRSDVWEGHETYFLESDVETILTLKVNGRGSDGMSEMVFPFEGISGGRSGGCESDKAPAYDMYEVFLDLGAKE